MPALARAQQVAVEVTPLRVELKTGPGGTMTQTVRLINQDREPVRIHATIDDWFLSKDGTPQFHPAEPGAPYAAAAWLRVNPVEIVAQPGVETTVRFTVSVPTTAQPGGYRTAIMFEFLPPGNEPAVAARGVAFRSRVATLVYLIVGAPVPAIELVDWQPRPQAGRPDSVVATLRNTGHVHVRTRGQVVVYRQDGLVVRRLALPDVPVLPESERDLVVALTDEAQPAPLPPGQYRLEVRIDVGLPEVLVGETAVTIGR